MTATRLLRSFLTGGAVATTLGLLACSSSDFHIEVSVRYPDDTPLTGLEVTALPFDRDAIRDSLAAASEVPRPQFPELEVELAEYTPPDISGFDDSAVPWQVIHDSVQQLADSLMGVGTSRSPTYARAYARLREQYRRLAESTADRNASIRARFGEYTDLANRAALAADILRAWEGTAFAGFPELADSAMSTVGRGIHNAETDSDGNAFFSLEPGKWWIVASCVHPQNPFKKYYWNVPVVVGRLGTRMVPLFDGNGASRWRY